MWKSIYALVAALAASAPASWPHRSMADEASQGARPHAGAAALAEEESASISVILDFARVLTFDQPARTIIIGNPAIVDGTLNDERTLVLTGKGSGTTNLIVLGEGGREVSNLVVNVAPGSRRTLTVYQGTAQQTFSCLGPCRPAAPPSSDK